MMGTQYEGVFEDLSSSVPGNPLEEEAKCLSRAMYYHRWCMLSEHEQTFAEYKPTGSRVGWPQGEYVRHIMSRGGSYASCQCLYVYTPCRLCCVHISLSSLYGCVHCLCHGAAVSHCLCHWWLSLIRLHHACSSCLSLFCGVSQANISCSCICLPSRQCAIQTTSAASRLQQQLQMCAAVCIAVQASVCIKANR